MRRGSLPAALALGLAACSSGPVPPAALDTRNEACRFCRMHVSDKRCAAQLVAPGEEPLFFDDLGCLAGYLKARSRQPRGEVAYVADHRTGDWVAASQAVFTRVEGLETPMGSHVIAHADAVSRDADGDARGGVPRSLVEILGTQLAGERP
jgi:copper chaperone NosL